MYNLIFIFGAKYLFILSLLIGGIFFLKQPLSIKKKMVIFAVPTLVTLYFFAFIGGVLYYNPRPFVIDHTTPLIPHAVDNGFPSDHVLLVASISAIVYYFNKRISYILWLITIFVAISRIYVGVHHPIDVVASMIFAITASCVTNMLIHYVQLKQEK